MESIGALFAMVALALTAPFLFPSAHAGTITVGSVEASSPNNFESFDAGATNGASLSNEFSGDGITFTTTAASGAVYMGVTCNGAPAGFFAVGFGPAAGPV